MSKPHREDEQIAEIFQKMMKGDKQATDNLRGIKYQGTKNESEKPKTDALLNKKQEEENELKKQKKSETFRTYLKEKVSQLRKEKAIYNQNKEISQYPNTEKGVAKNEYNQARPFKKKIEDKVKNQISKQLASIEEKQEDYRKNQKNAKRQEQPVYRSNTKDAFKTHLSKNIIKEEKSKAMTPPSSKHSFRIKSIPGISKKLRDELINLNEQEKTIQNQILTFHNQTKTQIESIKQKYNLKFKKQTDSPIKSQKVKKYSEPNVLKLQQNQDSGVLNMEKEKTSLLYQQIQQISAQIQKSKSKVKEFEFKAEASPIIGYMHENADIFQARQSEEQADDVGELPDYEENGQKKMGQTYQNLMKEIKKKKWGLAQRFQYDYQKPTEIKNTQNLQEQQIIEHSEENTENKVIVNSRLKNLLFD